MPSLRKRHRETETDIPIPVGANAAGMAPTPADDGASREPSSPSFRPTATADSAPSDDAQQDDLRARLAQLEASERRERERIAQAQAEIISHMVPRTDAPQDDLEQRIAPFPEGAKDWLRQHREFVYDRGKTNELLAIDQQAVAAGHEQFSESYLRFLDESLGFREPQPQRHDAGAGPRLEHELPPRREAAPAAQRPKPVPQLASEPHDKEQERPPVSPEAIRRATLYSAPPTRENVSPRTGMPSNSRVTLTPTEREIAKSSGLTEIQYAEQKLRLQREKAADPERFR